MQKKTAKKPVSEKPVKEKITPPAKDKTKAKGSPKPKKVPAKPLSKTAAKKSTPAVGVQNSNKPGLRSIYSNSRHTLLPLGFATDYTSKKQVVIFSDLATGKVHTVALAVWNRWKMKEVKKINTET